MKYTLSLLVCLTSFFFAMHVSPVLAETELTESSMNGLSAILIDATTGEVLFQKNPDEKLYPASITKIATGILAIEQGNPEDIVTVSKKARGVEGTRVYLAEGERVTMEKLEYGLLMNSGNDAAIAIAEHMSGSTEAFGERLTAYVKEKAGVTNTNFTNPHGLHDDNHYTTAADMAKIARYAMQNPTFRKIVATKRLPWNGAEWQTVIVNHNKLLNDYEGATGIKNGFTDEAHSTLVGSAKRGQTELIAVTMKADTSAATYKDITQMLDYGFAHFETVQVAKKGEEFYPKTAATMDSKAKSDEAKYIAGDDLYVTVPRGAAYVKEASPGGELLVKLGVDKEYSLPLLKLIEPGPKPAVEQKSRAVRVDSSLPQYLLFFLWLLFNIYLIIYAVRRYQKKRRTVIGQPLRKRADWQ